MSDGGIRPRAPGRLDPSRPGARGPGSRALLAFSVAALVVALPAPLRSQEQDREVTLRASRERDDRVRTMNVRVSYGAGRFRIEPAEAGDLYRYEYTYDRTLFSPVREWSVRADTGDLRLGLERSPDEEGKSFWWRLLHLDFDFGFDRLGESDNRLTVGLGPEIPTTLDLEVGAAENRLRLGGLSLESLRIATGATSTELSFHEPNRTVMEELRVEAGAASFRAEGLGNARVRELVIRGGAGDIRLEFGGEWRTDTRASVRVGMGSVRIEVPEELGVRITKSTFLGSFDPPTGFLTTDDGVVSQNWSDAEHRLDLDVNAVLGSVDVDRIP